MFSIGFRNQYARFLGIFDVNLNITLSQSKTSELMEMLQIELHNRYLNTNRINTDFITNIENFLGESGSVKLDLNLFYYGKEYIESILDEWSESVEPSLCFFFTPEKFVLIDEEGSSSILERFISENIVMG